MCHESFGSYCEARVLSLSKYQRVPQKKKVDRHHLRLKTFCRYLCLKGDYDLVHFPAPKRDRSHLMDENTHVCWKWTFWGEKTYSHETQGKKCSGANLDLTRRK